MPRRKSNEKGSVIKSKDGRWYGRYTVTRPDGQREHTTVYGDTKAEVEVKLARIMAERNSEAIPDMEDPTVEEYITLWLEVSTSGNNTPRRYHDYRLLSNRHIIPTLGQNKLSKLTPLQIRRLYRLKLDSGLSPRSVRNIHTILYRSLERAVKWHLITRNPAASVDFTRARRYTPDSPL